MAEETKKDEEIKEEKDEKVIEAEELVKEVADLDFTLDETPFTKKTGTSEDEDKKDEKDSKTVKDETKDKGDDKETVKDDKKPVEKDKEIPDGEKKEKKDEVVVEKKKDEEISPEKKPEKAPVKDEGKKDVPQIDKLLAEVDRLSGLVRPGVSEVKPSDDKEDKDEKKDKDKKVIKEAEVITDTVYDFVKGLDMDDVASDPAVFNKIMHEVIARVQRQTTEQVLLSIPQVVMSQVQQQVYFKRMADDFYKDNSDLVNVRQVVRACAQQVQKENPEWEIEKVFSEAAVRTRKTLGITAQKVGKEKEEEGDDVPSVDDAAFAKATGGSKSNLKQRKSGLQAEIDEL